MNMIILVKYKYKYKYLSKGEALLLVQSYWPGHGGHPGGERAASLKQMPFSRFFFLVQKLVQVFVLELSTGIFF